MTTTQNSSEERVCGYRSCGKSLKGRHGKAKYCDSKCRIAQLTTKIDEITGEERELRLGYGCQHPAERQAEPVERDKQRRHPYTGNRPEWSGYCVYKDCECSCHGGGNA
jgi:hypothetical protein